VGRIMGSRMDNCLHESAHSVVRQLLIGDLGEMGFKKWGAYSYTVERRPLEEMDAEALAKIAVVVEAGMVAERKLCSNVGNESLKEHAISDDFCQLEGIQRIAGFSDEQMEAFAQEAAKLVEAHETAIRKVATELNRRNKLNGEQVTRLMEKYPKRRMDGF
jgi:arginyl-tRNA synthetase